MGLLSSSIIDQEHLNKKSTFWVTNSMVFAFLGPLLMFLLKFLIMKYMFSMIALDKHARYGISGRDLSVINSFLSWRSRFMANPQRHLRSMLASHKVLSSVLLSFYFLSTICPRTKVYGCASKYMDGHCRLGDDLSSGLLSQLNGWYNAIHPKVNS